VADDDELHGLAGEYVLGTLDPEERRAAEARVLSDRSFCGAVALWETRLQPLADALTPVIPRAALFDRILRRVDGLATPGANVVGLRRSLRRWRLTTAVLAAAAAALAAVVVLDRSIVTPQSEFVAVLTADGAKPAFVATVNVAAGTIALRRIGEDAPADKSYELWAVAPNAPPRSLGLIEQASFSRGLSVAASGDITLAVSLEPKGGSPTGAPTGPVVFSGALVPTE
jgi:anti-sigma-K factor RskA